jgi:hypothetical protein
VYPDPVPPPLSECSSFPAAFPFDTTVEEIALLEMHSPILVLASVIWEASRGGHGSPPDLTLSQSPDPCKPNNTRSEKEHRGGFGD